MDYSTISNKTSTETEDISDGELSERYYLLKKQFDTLSISYETTKQELYDTRRSYQTALDVQSHLSTELENHQAEEQRRKHEVNSRHASLQEEISVLRQERTEYIERHASEIKSLETQIRNYKEELSHKKSENPERDNSELEEERAALNSALIEAVKAKAALEDAHIQMESWRLKATEMISEMGEMRAAVELRKEELRAANEREAVALADLAEARAMLHQNNVQDLEPHAAKGNSLFAEVEDKRQEMAKNLIQMKQTNSRLRRELANKQAELDTLLQEKQTIWEQQAGAAAHYDRELIESYEARISQLEEMCERQRRELARWFGKLAEPTAHGWLPGVLDHLRSECERLRAEVLSQGAAQLAAAAQLRDVRRKLALLSKPLPYNDHHRDESTEQTSHTKPDKAPIVLSCKEEIVKAKRPSLDDVKKKVSFN